MNVFDSKWRWVVAPLGGVAISTSINWLWFGTTDYGDAAFGLVSGLLVVATVELKRRSSRCS